LSVCHCVAEAAMKNSYHAVYPYFPDGRHQHFIFLGHANMAKRSYLKQLN